MGTTNRSEMPPTFRDPQAAMGQRLVADSIFQRMMAHMEQLSIIHNNIVPETDAGTELVEKIEARMLDIFNHLPEGQI